MSKRDRGGNNTNSLILAACILLVIFGVSVGLALWQHKLSRDQARAYHPEQYTQQPSGICIKFPPVIAFCPQEQGGPNAEAQRNEDDLKAQQEMADWAFAVVLISAVGFFLSLIGVVLIYATFRATRKGNKINQRIGEAQVRAYLSFEQAKITIQRKGIFGEIIPRIDLEIVNSGNSPALRFRWGAKFVYAYEGCHFVPRGGTIETAEHNGQDIPAQVSKARQWLEFPVANLWKPDVDAWKAGKLRVYVDILTASVDVFGRAIEFNERFRADIPANREGLTTGSIVMHLSKGTSDAPNYVAEIADIRVARESLAAALANVSANLDTAIAEAEARDDDPREPD